MKAYVTFATDGEPLRSLTAAETVAFDEHIVLPDVGDVVFTSGVAEHRTEKVISRQFTYFADQVREFIVLSAMANIERMALP
jgi:hypothetical protein